MINYNYRIFQAPSNVKYCFRDFDDAMRYGLTLWDYVSVYAGEVKADTIGEALEKVFIRHNAPDRPNGNCIRSLSMSDVVTIDGTPYYCNDIGWSEIPADRWPRARR